MRIHLQISNRFAVLALMIAIGCGGGPAEQLTIPDSPDGTVRVVMRGLNQHQPVILWRALPPSYQQDVIEVSAGFADSVDPAIFDRAVAVARKGAVVLQQKKELILATETIKGANLEPEAMDALWEAYVHILDAVLASEVASLEGLRNIDVDEFLSTTGVALMDQTAAVTTEDAGDETLAARLEALERTEVELVRRDGDNATVRVIPPEGEPAEVEMTRVEGRWVPVDLVEQWSGMIAQADAQIEFLGSEEAAQMKVQLLFAIGVAEGFIDQIAEMESPEELDELIGGILGNLVAAQQSPMITEG